MNKINERFKQIRKDQGLTQAGFASKLNLSRSAVGNYDIGRTILTDRTISDVCRIFNVNEKWLRTGVGDMYRSPIGQTNELVRLITDLIQTVDDSTKLFIIEYLKSNDNEKELIKKIMRTVKEYL